jgi:MFS family permease
MHQLNNNQLNEVQGGNLSGIAMLSVACGAFGGLQSLPQNASYLTSVSAFAMGGLITAGLVGLAFGSVYVGNLADKYTADLFSTPTHQGPMQSMGGVNQPVFMAPTA